MEYRGTYLSKRVCTYKSLVESVGLYGAEIWGWDRKVELDRIQRKYIKWLLGLERTTADYLVAEESKEIATSLKAMKRTIMYEEKAIETDKKLVKDCLFEIEKEKQIEIGEWELKRVNCLEKVNLGKKEREKIRNDEGNIVRELFERWVRKYSEWRKENIEKSKSCGRYKIIVTEKIPEYMTKELKSKERKVLARFRVGNEERANKY